jgi:hypothetical protein
MKFPQIVHSEFSETYRFLRRHAPSGLMYGERVERICEALEGFPYQSNPLGGGPGETEEFRVSLSSFDCVTFVESVTALAATVREPEFLSYLRQLRYEEGRVDYFRRRHYMADWIEWNAAAGRMIRLAADSVPEKNWRRMLDVVPALESRTSEVRGWPKTSFRRVRQFIRSGDLIFFISLRKNLDYFHTGVLLRRHFHILLAHASRSLGKVVIMPLEAFLKEHRMSGMTIVRPAAAVDQDA